VFPSILSLGYDALLKETVVLRLMLELAELDFGLANSYI
jgi:hypothetical protein